MTQTTRNHGLVSCIIKAIAILFFATVGWATEQSNPSSDSEADAPEDYYRVTVTVTAGLPELATEVLDADDVENASPNDLAEALRATSGLSAVRRGSINLDPTLRGLSESQIAISVDGTRTFAAGPARMDSDLSHLSGHAIDTLAVVKGPYALTWGSGALSAIDVRTFRPTFSGPLASGRAGVYLEDNTGAVDAYGHAFGSTERSRWTLLANLRRGDDYEDGNGVEIPGDYTADDLRWRFGVAVSDNATLDYSGGYQDQRDLDYPGRLLDATYFKTRSHSLRYLWSGLAGNSSRGLTRVLAQLYSNRKDHLMNNDEKPTGRAMPGRVPPFALDIALPTESNTSGGRVRADLGFGDWSFVVGADHYLSEKTADRFVRRRSNGFLIFTDRVWPDAELTNTGLFGQAVLRTENFELGGAIRFDAVDAEADPTPFFVANTSGAVDQSEDNVSVSISSRFSLTDQLTLSAGVGRAARTATILERYSDRFPSTKFQIAAEFMGNPALDPEQSLEADLGLSWRTNKVTLELDGFHRTIDDYITVVADPSLPKRLPLSPPTVFRYVNGDEAAFYGAEFRFVHRVTDAWSWRANVEFLRGDDGELKEPVLGLPADQLRLSLRFAPPSARITSELELVAADDQNRVATSRFEKPSEGYEVANLRFSWQMADSWRLTAAVENLTDEAYPHHLNAPNPFTRERILEAGRTARLGLRWSR